MKRLVVGSISLSALVFVAAAVAHTFVASPSIGIHKIPAGTTVRGAKVVVYGKINSQHSFCRAGRTVRLLKVRPGPDRFLAADGSDQEGEYMFVRHPRRDQTVYTRISRRVSTSYGHSHTCRAARSPNLFINVKRP